MLTSSCRTFAGCSDGDFVFMKRAIQFLTVSLLLFTGGLLIAGCAAAQYKAPPNTLKVSGLNTHFSFEWAQSRFGDRLEPHSALLVPVVIEGSPKTLYMQFDLGTPSTVLKANKLKSLQDRLGGWPTVTEGDAAFASKVEFRVGNLTLSSDRIKVRKVGETSAIDWDNPQAIDVIGTIGSDLLDGRVLVIDYANKDLFLGDHVPEGVALSSAMSPFTFKERRVILQDVAIDGKKTQLMLDTGSSAFALLTDKTSWQRMTSNGAGATTFPVNSWGKTLTAHMAPTKSRIRFGAMEIPLGSATYIEGTSFMQNMLMRATGMGGMTGNKLFVDRALVLDARTLTYAVTSGKTEPVR